MAYRIRKVNYCYLMVPSRAGQSRKILGALRDEGVNLLAFSGFPAGAGKAQVDLVSDDMNGVRRVARQQGWRLMAGVAAPDIAPKPDFPKPTGCTGTHVLK